jgi:hypothetical protein
MREGEHLEIFAGVAVGVHLWVPAQVELAGNAARFLHAYAFTMAVSARQSTVVLVEAAESRRIDRWPASGRRS